MVDNYKATMSPTRHLPYLDGWRGLAIAFLLIGHFFPVPGINLGTFGVNLFFVLSGLLMSRILFLDKVEIPTFYRRRISRIFPAVFVFFIVTTALYAILGRPVNWAEVLAAATFTNNYFPGEPGNAQMPFGHIWSLSVEEHSYVLLSILAILARRRYIGCRAAVAFCGVLFAGAGIFYWSTYRGEHLDFDRWIHSEVSAFAIFAAAFVMLNWMRKPASPALAVPVLFALGLALHWWSVPAPVRTIAGCGALALAINFLAGAHPLIRAALSLRPLRQLGAWSFSIYLWQQPFYLMVRREGMPPTVGLVLGICAGALSFYLIERPSRAYLNRVWNGRKDVVPALKAPEAA